MLRLSNIYTKLGGEIPRNHIEMTTNRTTVLIHIIRHDMDMLASQPVQHAARSIESNVWCRRGLVEDL